VLDYGCGHGMAAVVLARAGGRVTAFDLSPGYVCEAKARAAANDVPISFLEADAERLPFADGSFDRVWGNAILHHLDLRTAAGELHRLLRPGGRAVFCEPWGENALLRWARSGWTAKPHTRDERPLRRRDLYLLRDRFPGMKVRGYQLLAMARRLLPSGRMASGLERCDTALLECLPGLQRYCRYVVITLPC
jgi:SAM-dependent methyltransferase